jgi:hypothetical protein
LIGKYDRFSPKDSSGLDPSIGAIDFTAFANGRGRVKPCADMLDVRGFQVPLSQERRRAHMGWGISGDSP